MQKLWTAIKFIGLVCLWLLCPVQAMFLLFQAMDDE